MVITQLSREPIGSALNVRHRNLDIGNGQTGVRLNLSFAFGTLIVATTTPKVCPVCSTFLVLVEIQNCFIVIYAHIASLVQLLSIVLANR